MDPMLKTSQTTPEPQQPQATNFEQPAPQFVAPAPVEEDTTVNVAADQPAQDSSNQSPLAAAESVQKPRSKTPVLAIILAVIIAGGLAAFAIFTYVGSKDDKKAESTTQQTATKTQPAATSSDVDAASTDVDNIMGTVNDTTDFDENAISDAALGL